jgi:hypothetical protein
MNMVVGCDRLCVVEELWRSCGGEKNEREIEV